MGPLGRARPGWKSGRWRLSSRPCRPPFWATVLDRAVGPAPTPPPKTALHGVGRLVEVEAAASAGGDRDGLGDGEVDGDRFDAGDGGGGQCGGDDRGPPGGDGHAEGGGQVQDLGGGSAAAASVSPAEERQGSSGNDGAADDLQLVL